MYTIDDIEKMLDDIAAELPDAFWNHLHGGVIVLPDLKFHEAGRPGDLTILGDYCNYYNYGRHIRIYYGSFMHLYGYLPPEQLREKLRKTLIHEFTHHLESLAGERGLEIQDKIELERYRRRHENL